MYRLMIVDDEENIRQGLIARLCYLGISFETVLEASGGEEALHLLKSQPVDIVITDIQMPDLNGLTFIERAAKIRSGMKFIVLSGYAEFSYAERAITLGVSSYLLKPLSNEVLKEALEKAEEQLKEDQKVRYMERSHKSLVRQQRDYLLEREINTLFNARGEKNEKSYPYLKENHPALLKGKSLLFGILNIESASYERESFDREDADLLRFSIKNVFEELTSSCEKIMVNSLVHMEQLYVVFAADNPNWLREEAEQIFLRVYSLFEKKLEVTLTMGMSSVCAQAGIRMQEEASEALKQQIVYGRANIYFYEDRKMLEAKNFPTSELMMLGSYMERRDMESMKQAVHRIFSEQLSSRYGIGYIRMIWVRILNMFLQNLRDPETNEEQTEKILSSFSLVDEMFTVEELEERIDTLLMECVHEEYIKDANAENKIKVAIAYMKQNFERNITINELAQRYDMSPNYFSTMFKKEMNQSAVNYLTTLRMEKAAWYLTNTDKNVTDISRCVGYEDSQYFFRVFKKAMGVTPLMYRKEYKMNENKKNENK